MSGEWVNLNDVFYGATAYDFRPLQNMVRNGSFETGSTAWDFVGKAAVSLRNPISRRGTAHARLHSDTGGVQRMWQTVHIDNAVNVHRYKLSAWVRMAISSSVTVRLRVAKQDHFLAPVVMGAILKEQTVLAKPDAWKLVEFEILQPPAGSAAIEFEAYAPNGQYSSVRIDDVWLTKVYPPGTTSPTHGACVPGKLGQDGYDEGCPEEQ